MRKQYTLEKLLIDLNRMAYGWVEISATYDRGLALITVQVADGTSTKLFSLDSFKEAGVLSRKQTGKFISDHLEWFSEGELDHESNANKLSN